jgi:DNA-binding GntR family transcriptional regulator
MSQTQPVRIKAQPRRSILSDETYSMIRAMIFAHEIVPGERVNIDALSLQLGVSQTPIREALARLESEDLIAKEPLKGYRATDLLTIQEFADLFSFRLLIEPYAAEQAAFLIDSHGIKELQREITNAKEALYFEDDRLFEAFTEHDARFHTLIAKFSGSKALASAFTNTHCHLHLFRLYVATQKHLIEDGDRTNFIQDLFARYYQSDRGQLAIKQHVAIAKAIASHNPEKAKAEMYSHIESSLKRFTADLQLVHTDGKANER